VDTPFIAVDFFKASCQRSQSQPRDRDRGAQPVVDCSRYALSTLGLFADRAGRSRSWELQD